jgi:NAD(P)-dependent dehydrogenase (short-subunit alcohol dehydrogenase family)
VVEQTMAEGNLVALVTGGGRGIGLACVERLLADGLRVGVVEINEKAILTARERVVGQAERVHFVAGSVADRAAMEVAAQELVGRWGRLDVLVNNAAVNRAGGLLSQTDAEWHAIIEVNLTGAFVTSAVVAAVMQERGCGAIINIGSIGAAGFGASPAYAASKAGLIGLTRQMARELGPQGITVNVVAPGVTTTEWVERNLGPERIAQAAETAPLRRVATPEDIAGAVSFLASRDARHITGQVISVSGGQWMP